MTRLRILTGDTPTGRLHLGHLVGSLENRVRLQHTHDCFILIANVHAFTTRADRPDDIRRDTLEIVRDYIAVGLDPERVSFVLQSEIGAIAELTVLLAMLLPYQRVMRNPTLKDELAVKGLGDRYSFGFPLYAVGQCADILAFRAHVVPVGEDQAAHIEMCREVARRFDQQYGDVFPIPEALIGRVARLPGIDGMQKMSKSLDNAIYLSDDAATIRAKMARLQTGRTSMTEPGDPDNALFTYARTFMTDQARVAELADRYARGDQIGDSQIKMEVAAAIDAVVAPMRERRAAYEGSDDRLLDMLRAHTQRANGFANETLALAKAAMRLDFR
jgi:tryptophanyl-tRNA synthetase